MPDPSLLETVEAIALSAGEAILRVYGSDFDVQEKADDSPVTQADLAAHRIIERRLSALTPEYPVLSEEGHHADFEERAGWHRYWLVDPLDGTREVVRRNGEFSVNIALIEDDRPILGVVYAPTSGKIYSARRGHSAHRADASGRVPIRTRTVPGTPSIFVSRSHQDTQLQAMMQRLPEHHALSRGSSLKFCAIAEGEADLYPRTGPTSEWDTAAGQCVLEAAGGAVLRLPELTPLRYNQKASLINPGFVVVGDTAFGWPERLRGD